MTTLNDADKARQLADEAHAVLLQADHDRAPHLLIALAKVYAELAKLTACPVIPQGTELAFHNQAGALVTGSPAPTQIHTGLHCRLDSASPGATAAEGLTIDIGDRYRL
ncbi:hypothetical protein SANTM175S_02362 [Streptomyces antimycoticus]